MVQNNKKWLIVDDDFRRGKRLSDIIRLKYPEEKIVWFYVNKNDFSKPNGERGLTSNVKITHIKSVHRLIDVIWPFTDNSIILFDMYLDDISESDLDEPTNPLTPLILNILKYQKKVLFTITTPEKNTRRQVDAFPMKYHKKMLVDSFNIDKSNGAFELVDKAGRKWKDLYELHPMRVFLDKMATRYSAELSAENNHNWGNSAVFPPKQLHYLCEFLVMPFSRFQEYFNLPKRDNAIGEYLKVFGTRDIFWLPMLGIVLIAYAAYRRNSSSKDKSRVNTIFKKLIKNIIADWELDETKVLAGRICRYADFLPPQIRKEYDETLVVLYNMFTELFYYGDNLRLIDLKLEDGKLQFIIEDDNLEEFINHLNEYKLNSIYKDTRKLHDSIERSGVIEFAQRFTIRTQKLSLKDCIKAEELFNSENAFFIESRTERHYSLCFKMTFN